MIHHRSPLVLALLVALAFPISGACGDAAQPAGAAKDGKDTKGSSAGSDKKGADPASAASAASAAPAAVPAANGTPAASEPAAAPSDPFAQGFCEYTIEGGAANKGGGGLSNVQSSHWMMAGASGRSMAGKLLINCGDKDKITIQHHNFDEELAMAAGKYPIDKTGAAGTMSIIGPFPLAEAGELDITAWDTSHMAGTFSFSVTKDGASKKVTGSFDLRCPYAASDVCVPK